MFRVIGRRTGLVFAVACLAMACEPQSEDTVDCLDDTDCERGNLCRGGRCVEADSAIDDVGGGDGTTGDGATGDGSIRDASRADAEPLDAGSLDAGSPDAGSPDAGSPDAGSPDAGSSDARPPDAGESDSSPDACVATQELCNGADDDCDGEIDEDFPDLGRPCSEGLGACEAMSMWRCDGSDIVCDATPGEPTAEVCNSIDDDCDGEIDEAFPEIGEACTSGRGACLAAGVRICGADGALVCDAVAGAPGDELCNGIDDDCDGDIDEDYEGLGTACEAGLGACRAEGEVVCAESGEGVACTAAATAPTDETCNGLDDDCDGEVDEAFAELGDGCELGVGRCRAESTRVCADDGTQTVCDATPGEPSDEACNGLDDDCDGEVDEAFVELGDGCELGVGRCRAEGTRVCAEDGTQTVCNATPGEPSDEACNGLDDDCDGEIDEAFAGLGGICTAGQGACRANGELACTEDGSGTICDAQPGAAGEEACNGIDDDCDGDIDEDYADLGEACAAGQGGCRTEGQRVCADDGTAVVCNAVPAEPTDEVCNFVDDDCDDEIDEDFPQLGEICQAGLGACRADGVLVCAGDGGVTCNAEVGLALPESCNLTDDDCDGEIDETFDDLGDPCQVGQGECREEGVRVCAETGRGTVCGVDGGLAFSERCNGLDDDCDAAVDEDFPKLGDDCEVGVGECAASGVVVCAADGGAAVCSVSAGQPVDEVCNGLDDDCDGELDEDFDDLGSACTVGLGVCARSGNVACADDGASAVCDVEAGEPGVEVCNGLDDDCDGAIDEGFVGLGDACGTGTGACAATGTIRCIADGSAAVCDAVEGTPVDEICNGLDDDCDGTIDEPFDDLGDACEDGAGICAVEGERICRADGNGTRCSAIAGDGSDEICNGVDDDCDGSVDEGYDGLGVACGVGIGACATTSVTVCNATHDGVVCGAVAAAPISELCNGIDDDCDGDVDERFVFLGAACSAGDGACERNGEFVCRADGSGTECGAVPGDPVDETCDGIDNDCDGELDEDFEQIGDACEVGIGRCRATGELRCNDDGDGVTCSANAGMPTPEICNFEDDDCDGTVDEGYVLGDPCFVGVGACRREGIGQCGFPFDQVVCSVVPAPRGEEACNGIDDDCDGQIDEDYGDLGDPCHVGTGECAASGVRICADSGADTTCGVDPGQAVDELCNGLDDDCDGTADEDFADEIGAACSAGLGVCAAAGERACAGDGVGTVCVAPVGSPVPEICNGEDDDCDGLTDEDFASLGEVCTDGVGACFREGQVECGDDGGARCSVVAGDPVAERCDGVDNDCDGAIDEIFPTLGDVCGGDGVGACAGEGVLVCNNLGDQVVCSVDNQGTDERCNGEDDNCDGSIDEDFGLIGEECTVGLGECARTGTLLCDLDELGSTCTAIAGEPSHEFCDGLDNDCDGEVDENYQSFLGDPCLLGVGGCRRAGEWGCSDDGTTIACVGEAGEPTAELCNGADDDCDVSIDEDFPELGTVCTVGLGECATSGVYVCDDDGGSVCDAEPGPAEAERCDGLDNDCDGAVDEDLGIGDPCFIGEGLCAAAGVTLCDFETGDTYCDGEPLPPQPEGCTDGFDEDCDGEVDETCRVVFRAISAGKFHNCGIVDEDNTLLCWGRHHFGQLDAPAGAYESLDAGFETTCALEAITGSGLCWGLDLAGGTVVPDGEFAWVGAGENQSCGLRPAGTLECWGSDERGERAAPAGQYLAVTAGRRHGCAIRAADRGADCWGDATRDRLIAAEGPFTRIDAGDAHTCGLRDDRSIVCWGDNSSGQLDVPDDEYMYVSAGDNHSCGLRLDGSGVCWGSNARGQLDVPAEIFTQLEAGNKGHTCGLRAIDGTVGCWGNDGYGQSFPP